MMKKNNIGQMRIWVSKFPLYQTQPPLVTRSCFPFPTTTMCTRSSNRSSLRPCPRFLCASALSSPLTSPPSPLLGVCCLFAVFLSLVAIEKPPPIVCMARTHAGIEDELMGYLSGNEKATRFAHLIWKNVVQKGDIAIDATCGNGYDTLAMVKLVAGESGRGSVYGFDIQRDAIDSTSSLLDENLDSKEREVVKVYHMCHSRMEEVVPENGPVRLVAFNLGYLPGGDKTVTTLPQTTLLALESAKKMVVSGGLISLVVYVGHPGGREELEKVEEFTCGLGVEDWVCSKFQMLNRPLAPVLVLLFKR